MGEKIMESREEDAGKEGEKRTGRGEKKLCCSFSSFSPNTDTKLYKVYIQNV